MAQIVEAGSIQLDGIANSPRRIVDAGSIKLDSANEDRSVISWRNPQPVTLWDRIRAVFPEDSAAEAAKAKNALIYSEMFGIRPSVAYEYHDEISEQFRNKTAGQKIVTEKRGVGGAAKAGWESSIAGMMFNQRVPQPFESVSQAETFLRGMVSMGVDLPFFLAGYGIGGANPVSGMAGGFGFTAGLRQILIDRYTKGEVKDATDLFDRMGNAARETIKGQIVGGFTGGARVIAGPAFARLTGGLEAPAAWTMLNEVAAMTAAGKMIEGQLPTASDFIDTAAALLVIHAGTRGYEAGKVRLAEVRDKLKTSYVESGAHPKTILNEISKEVEIDPQEDVLETIERVNQELKAQSPEAAPEAKAEAKVEPPPAEIVQPGADLKVPDGYIPIYRGTGKRGFQELKATEGGVYGDGVYFYTEPSPARSHATTGGGVITGFVRPEDAIIKGNVAVVKDPSKIIQRGKISVEDTLSTGAEWTAKTEKALSEGKPVPPSVLKDYPEMGKPEPKPTGTTSIKNATVDTEREARGLPPIETPVSARGKDWRKQVEDKVDSGEIRPSDISRRINNAIDNGEKIPGELITDETNHALLYEKKRLQNEYAAIEEAIDKQSTPELIERRSELERRLDENELATKAIGTEQGRALQSRQDMMAEDYSLPAMIRRARNEGVTITPEVRTELKTLSKKIAKAQKAVDGSQDAIAEESLKKTIKRIQNEESLAARKEKRAMRAEELDAEFDKVADAFAKSVSGLYANPMFNPEAYQALISMARNRIQKGIVKAEDIIDSIHTALVNKGLEFSKRDIRDAISRYGVEVKQTKDELKIALNEAKRQMRLLSALEDAKKGVIPPKRGRVPEKSDEILKLQKQVKEAMRESGLIPPAKTMEERALQAYKTRTENQIADLERRLKEGDYTDKPKRRKLEIDDETLKRKFVLDSLKREYAKKVVNYRLAERSLPTIASDSIIEAMNLVRAIKSSFDVSAPGRQGFFAIISHPIKGFKNIPDMFRALGSEEAAYRIEQEIRNRPNYKLYEEGGLSLTDTMKAGTNVEEIYRSRWAEKLPGIPASNRAFTSYLNLIRADLFDSLHKSAFGDRKATSEELKAIADYANMATGRGTIKGYENALQGLGTFFWAPKLVLSRFQMLLGKGLMPGGGRTVATRIAVAKEYARILTGFAVIYSVADFLGADIEFDPRSSDFGKIVVGNTRIDVLAGVSQATVLLSRLITGETKSVKTGRVKPIRGDYVPYGGVDTWGVLSNFMRTKLTPVLGLSVNMLQGKDIVGNKVTLYDIPRETVVPLAIMDIYDAMAEEGVPPGLALGTLGLFGIGIQTHEQKGARP